MKFPFSKPYQFSTDGSLDELIALDRYAVSTTDPEQMEVGDTVVFIYDELKGSRYVGEIISENPFVEGGDLAFDIKARNGQVFHGVSAELVTKPLETQPTDFWNRWAYGAALVEAFNNVDTLDEADEALERWFVQFAELFDGFGYSPGGRVQLGLGHEYLGLEKAPLTLTNCFVLPMPRGAAYDPYQQWSNVIDTVLTEMQISRRGGGVGINISNIRTVEGAGGVDVTLRLPRDHRDAEELRNMMRLGKFDGVSIVDNDYVDLGNTIFVGDSIEGQIEALRNMVCAAYEGNPVTLDFSQIRHRNAVVKGVNGRSSGAAAWMELFALTARLLALPAIDAVDFAEIFSFVINLIQQGGSRRGALMLVINDDHQCVIKFVQRKRTPGYLQGANISVGISDRFMRRLKRGKQCVENNLMILDDEQEAVDLWNLIIESAHASAEPGVIWLERYNELSNSWYYAPIVATNPCGEQGLPPNGACNLGHQVLPAYVVGDWAKGKATVDWQKLARAVRLGVRFQDNMVDYGYFPTPETEAQQKLERRIGMGTMGLGTMLIMLGLKYGSPEAEAFVNELYRFIAYHAYNASMDLAEEKGAFPAYNYEKHIQSGFMKHVLETFPELGEKLKRTGIRNVTILTQAPTGSTGTYIDNLPGMNTSTGIEPYYSFQYYRASRLGEGVMQEVELVKQYRAANGLTEADQIPDYFVCAMDLAPEAHVSMQAVVQRWVDSSISKTANAPADYSIEDTDKLYMLAYDTGCKGMTIYRDGSRQAQVLSTDKSKAKLESHLEAEKLADYSAKDAEINFKVFNQLPEVEPAPTITKRQPRLFGFTEKVKVVQGDRMAKVYITVNVDPNTGLPVEVFVSSNDAEVKSTAEALGRMTTQFLRFAHTEDNIDQATKHLRQGQSYGTLPWWIAHLLEGITYGKIELPSVPTQKKENAFKVCPSCGEKAYDKPNCICHACGTSHCN